MLPRAAVQLGVALAVIHACACARGPGADPFGRPIDPQALEVALNPVHPSCRERVRAVFESGQRSDGCVDERRGAARTLAKDSRRRFGLVDQRAVDLRGVSLVLLEARGCHQWPLRAPGYTVLTRPEASTAGCRLQRYSGPVQVTAIEADGTNYPGIMQLRADDGIVRLSFAEVDAVLRAHGFPGLDAFATLEIGRGGWAGNVNLDRLREFLATWHFVWVVRGRGSPGLFAALHAEHPRAGDARALSVEDLLSRQERDYLAVARGELSAHRFLGRYLWSPYARSVAAMAGAPAVPSPEVRVGPDAAVVDAVSSGGPPTPGAQSAGPEP